MAQDNESSKITPTGAPAFAVYLHVAAQSHAAIINMTFTGAATGTKYIREGGYIGVFPAQRSEHATSWRSDWFRAWSRQLSGWKRIKRRWKIAAPHSAAR